MAKSSDGEQALALVDTLFGLFGDMRQSMHLLLTAADSSGLAPMHLRVLQLCAREPGLTHQELVRRTGRDKGQIANLVKELCEKGMLNRKANPEDKRSHTLDVTPNGRKAAQRFEDLGVELGTKLVGTWSTHETLAFLKQVDALRDRISTSL